MGNDLSTSIAEALRPVLMRLDLVIRRQNTQYALSRAQTSILSTLSEHGDLRMSDLARIENVRVPTTSNSVSVIEAMGFVERVPDSADRRGVCVRLTDKGRGQIDEVLRARNADLAIKIEMLPTEQRSALSEALPALSALIDEYDNSAPQR